MKKITRILTLLLTGAMLLPVFAACEQGGNEGTTSVSDTDGTTVSTTSGQPDAKPVDSEVVQKYGEMALELVHNICSDYYATRTNMLRDSYKGSGRSSLWGFAAFLEALADAYALYPDDEIVKKNYVDALDEGLAAYKVTGANIRNTASGESYRNQVYYNATAGGTGDYYYDDDAWVCYQLLNAYVLLDNEKYLTEAEELLEFFKTGWDDKLGGGIHWDKSYSGKNTCANGPISICYLWAYELTGKDEYLEWGKKIYDWLQENMCENGLFCDGMGMDGGKNTWKADYNQGTPMYAASLIYKITGDETYLAYAKKTATAALGLAFENRGTRVNPDIHMKGNPIYKSWCVAWLMRGFAMYVSVSGKSGSYFNYMELVLDANVSTKNENGYYDPYFMTGDWTSESVTDVLQPCGVASVIATCALYERDIAPYVS